MNALDTYKASVARIVDKSLLRRTCELCVERVDALGLKGRRADNEALSFFVGVAQGFTLAGMEAQGKHIGGIAHLIVAIRGMFGVREMLARIKAEG